MTDYILKAETGKLGADFNLQPSKSYIKDKNTNKLIEVKNDGSI